MNNDILHKVLSVADLTIDSYLAFKHLGLSPKKLIVPKNTINLLNKFCNTKKRYYNAPLCLYDSYNDTNELK